MGNQEKKRHDVKKILLIVLCVLLALILIAMVAGTIYVEGKLNLIGRLDNDPTMSPEEYQEWLESQKETIDPNFTGPVIDPDDVTWGPTDPIEQGSHIVNILLIGQDRRAGESTGRSDSIILCTINKSAKTLTLTSFMRDMYVQIPGYQDDRINASYAIGGRNLLNECLKVNFGVQVDGNVEIDFFGFMEVIDMLGGVEISLTQAEASYLNRRGNWDINDASAGTWSLKAGVNKLTGEQALAYSRIRDIGNDFGRTERQRKVLSVLLERCKRMSVKELDNLLNMVLPKMRTDLTKQEIVSYTATLLPMLSELTVVTQRVPADGTYRDAWVREMLVMQVDIEANRKLLEACMQKAN